MLPECEMFKNLIVGKQTSKEPLLKLSNVGQIRLVKPRTTTFCGTRQGDLFEIVINRKQEMKIQYTQNHGDV